MPLRRCSSFASGLQSANRGKVEETSVWSRHSGDILPRGVPFSAVNRVMNKKALADFIDKSFRIAGAKAP